MAFGHESRILMIQRVHMCDVRRSKQNRCLCPSPGGELRFSRISLVDLTFDVYTDSSHMRSHSVEVLAFSEYRVPACESIPTNCLWEKPQRSTIDIAIAVMFVR
jgi:hypothetical protein